jgi:hypothetical protein
VRPLIRLESTRLRHGRSIGLGCDPSKMLLSPDSS